MDIREYRGVTRSGKWIYGSLIYDKPFCMIRTNGNLQLDVMAETVGQWTGCCDVNGEKIFEGDIIKYGSYLHVVEFDSPCYIGVRLARNYYYTLSKKDDGVIVGNIYDDRWMMDLDQ